VQKATPASKSAHQNDPQLDDDLNPLEVSADMKRDFCARLKKLSAQELTRFVAKCQEVTTSSCSEQDSKMQIKVDEWSRATFDQISTYVDEMLIQKEMPSKRQKTS
jgi:hypothetical protein